MDSDSIYLNRRTSQLFSLLSGILWSNTGRLPFCCAKLGVVEGLCDSRLSVGVCDAKRENSDTFAR